MKLNLKQTKALDFLEDDITSELEYGGAAGGGKSILGCYWQLKRRLKYPGTRGLIGRASRKTLNETTLNSFFQVANLQGLKAARDFKYNQQSNIIYFPNGSLIFLKDLYQYPADPNFDELGSLEITDAFVDENNQIVEKAWNIVKSRIRYKMTFCHVCALYVETQEREWLCSKCGSATSGLKPKMLGTCNPSKGWIYNKFYKPSKEGVLTKDLQFIQALVTDNPDISKHYRENLLSLDEASKQRLLYGNWEWDDDLSTLIQYDKIIDCFSNSYISTDSNSFITCDVARFGNDKTVIGLWSGWRVKLFDYSGRSVSEVAQIIKEYQQKYKVSNSNTIADEDGVGGGVVDILKCKGFVNNSRALDNPITKKPENYANLKSQCYFMLAEKINKGEIYVDCNNVSIREKIIQELEQVKQHNMDKDGRKQVVPKDKVKELIGRSPDFSDTLMMRMYFELAPKRTFTAATY